MQHKPTLTGLRGLAASLVVLAHMSSYGILPRFPFHTFGAIGVILFFVLSGYLMTALYLSQKPTTFSVQKFLLARFARVYPLYALVVVASALGSSLTGGKAFVSLGLVDVINHLLLLDGKYLFWTIVVEIKFYALFVVFWYATRRLSSNRKLIYLLAIYLACFLLPVLPRTSVFQNLQIFVLGMALALVSHKLPKGLTVLAPSLALIILATAVAAQLDQILLYRSIWVQLTMGLVVAVAVLRHAEDAKVLVSRILLKLGEWSFGIYLLHIPILRSLRMLADALSIHPALMIIPGFALSVVAAALAFRWVENPARAAIQRRIPRQVQL